MKVMLFTDASEFSHVFKREFGASPSDVRLLTQGRRPSIEFDDRPVAGRRWAERAGKPAV